MQQHRFKRHHNFFGDRLFLFVRPHLKSWRGQIFSEYGLVIVIVIAAASGMLIFTKRVIQARAYDAQTMVMQKAGASLGSGKPLPMEYEPYYYESSSITTADQTETVSKSFDQQYKKNQNSERTTMSFSTQHAPRN